MSILNIVGPLPSCLIHPRKARLVQRPETHSFHTSALKGGKHVLTAALCAPVKLVRAEPASEAE